MHRDPRRLVRRPLLLISAAALVFAACTGDGGATPGASATPAGSPSGASPSAGPDEAPTGLLAEVLDAGVIRMSTDPQYPPQSELTPDGDYQGFDIDVGREIAKRLGVDIQFETPSWDVLTAGSWGDRWDMSVGSMTITTPREKVLAFSEPYYYTPAQMAVLEGSGITAVDQLAGKSICVGAATTYLDWLQGSLDFGTKSPETDAPADVNAVTLDTDRLCAESWRSGRTDFEGWLSSSTTVQQAIDDGLPVEKVGDPVFYEPLAVAFDRSGADPAAMVERVNEILEEMRADGTLSQLSEKWFGTDLTTPPNG